MNDKEAAMILAVLQVAYPHFYRGVSKADATAAAKLWARVFEDESYEEVDAAVAALISCRTSTYPPVIGEVKEQLHKLRTPQAMLEDEAWRLVSLAVSRCDMQHPSREFEKLPPEVQRVVGSPNQLREWGMVLENEFQTVIGSLFRRAWRTHKERERELAAIPEAVRAVIGGVSEKLKLEEGE